MLSDIGSRHLIPEEPKILTLYLFLGMIQKVTYQQMWWSDTGQLLVENGNQNPQNMPTCIRKITSTSDRRQRQIFASIWKNHMQQI